MFLNLHYFASLVPFEDVPRSIIKTTTDPELDIDCIEHGVGHYWYSLGVLAKRMDGLVRLRLETAFNEKPSFLSGSASLTLHSKSHHK